jgi:hypothetical protein
MAAKDSTSVYLVGESQRDPRICSRELLVIVIAVAQTSWKCVLGL